MKVDFDEYWQESMKVARVEGIVSAYRILSEIDRRHGVDTSQLDRMLDLLEGAMANE